ncbi:hypothetical protein RFI_21464 [Reticulomyxa filosa]|uniref:Uncharacterized protein n=1 Tax=Reticulomyxa filosa TaxID=46433 RepID=X6MQJ9_RETFI|nr:hypothetical protein RFI_21464 [Reticulomyxa filosa]|eukprot:ETO15901.1 hypothetical protein RFI_21464 [Reticulomyxa filosa]
MSWTKWHTVVIAWFGLTYLFLLPLCYRELKRYWNLKHEYYVQGRKPHLTMALFISLLFNSTGILRTAQNILASAYTYICICNLNFVLVPKTVTLMLRLWLNIFAEWHTTNLLIPELLNMIVMLLLETLRLWHIMFDNQYQRDEIERQWLMRPNQKGSFFAEYKRTLGNTFYTSRLTVGLFLFVGIVCVLSSSIKKTKQ